MISDFFNSINNSLNDSLYRMDLKLHNKIENSFIDDFIHQLRESLYKNDAIYKINKLPIGTKLWTNEKYDDYYQCFSFEENYKEYPIPLELINFPTNNYYIQNNDVLELQPNRRFNIVKKLD
jgi:hypothetical protein